MWVRTRSSSDSFSIWITCSSHEIKFKSCIRRTGQRERRRFKRFCSTESGHRPSMLCSCLIWLQLQLILDQSDRVYGSPLVPRRVVLFSFLRTFCLLLRVFILLLLHIFIFPFFSRYFFSFNCAFDFPVLQRKWRVCQESSNWDLRAFVVDSVCTCAPNVLQTCSRAYQWRCHTRPTTTSARDNEPVQVQGEPVLSNLQSYIVRR